MYDAAEKFAANVTNRNKDNGERIPDNTAVKIQFFDTDYTLGLYHIWGSTRHRHSFPLFL
ncbi:hypothetical protein ELI_1885 [Eubacterium callanderi]|uniref:Uncharacterized protein n=1 Tax=Eubacterium callanderi TaxID=53442 RepID=E3GMC8_9FIRM|nr:hypothetical protein ELI_1885 [Eubacterium callanderi]